MSLSNTELYYPPISDEESSLDEMDMKSPILPVASQPLISRGARNALYVLASLIIALAIAEAGAIYADLMISGTQNNKVSWVFTILSIAELLTAGTASIMSVVLLKKENLRHWMIALWCSAGAAITLVILLATSDILVLTFALFASGLVLQIISLFVFTLCCNLPTSRI